MKYITKWQIETIIGWIVLPTLTLLSPAKTILDAYVKGGFFGALIMLTVFCYMMRDELR